MGNKAIILSRVSTEGQDLEQQTEEVIKRCNADGYAAEDIIRIEDKESGVKLSEEERLGLIELKSLIEKDDTIKVVYCYEISRIGRRAEVNYSIRNFLQAHRVQLIILKPSIVLFDKDFKIIEEANVMFAIFNALAENEGLLRKARVARGKKKKAEEMKYNGGQIPFGYRVDKKQDNRIVIDEERAAVVREIYQMYVGGMSQTQIAKEFHKRGYSYIDYRGNVRLMTISLVHTILNNEFLTGKELPEKKIVVKVRGEERSWTSYARRYDPIISEELYQRCREIADKNNNLIDKARNIYFASRLIKCPECGCYFVARKVSYYCYDAYNTNKEYNGYAGQPTCSNKESISINVLDSLLWHVAKKLDVEYRLTSAKDDIKAYEDKIIEIDKKLEAIEKRREKVEDRKQRLLMARIDGLSTENYNLKRSEIDAEEKEINKDSILYMEEKNHYQGLVGGLRQQYEVEISSVVNTELNNVITLYDSLDGIINDSLRSEIIHRHIKSVELERATIPYKFRKKKEEVMTEGRKITINTFKGDIYNFVYIPIAGKGRGYVIVGKDGKLTPIEVPYLTRFVDEAKRKRHKRESIEKKAIAKEKLERRQKDYLTITEAASLIGYSGNKITYDIHAGYLQAKYEHHTYYIRHEDFAKYKEFLETRGMYKGKRKSTSK